MIRRTPKGAALGTRPLLKKGDENFCRKGKMQTIRSRMRSITIKQYGYRCAVIFSACQSKPRMPEKKIEKNKLACFFDLSSGYHGAKLRGEKNDVSYIQTMKKN